MQNLKINGERLWDTIMETARFGGTEKGGVRRLTLDDNDKAVRDWLKAACEAAGCSVTVDQMGNMFARRPGKDDTLPPIAFGSHLDTQPTGGKFDGVLGVLAGLEVIRSLNDAEYQTRAPIELVNWTNEEGARFNAGCLGSSVFAGATPLAIAHALADKEGATIGAELTRIGYRGDSPCDFHQHPFTAMFEIHIEQGPVLEQEGKTIGVVTAVQGLRRYSVSFTGEEGHAGTTPMTGRRDALLGAARSIEAVNAIASGHPPDAVGTVGIVEVRPASTNVIPGFASHTVDFRHPSDATLDEMESSLRQSVARIAHELRLESEVVRLSIAPPVEFNAACIDAVRNAAEQAGLPHRDMFSRAGHDAMRIAPLAPTAMIFVPCENGISHNEAENATPADCAAGAQVLLGAVLAMDSGLGERERLAQRVW